MSEWLVADVFLGEVSASRVNLSQTIENRGPKLESLGHWGAQTQALRHPGEVWTLQLSPLLGKCVLELASPLFSCDTYLGFITWTRTIVWELCHTVLPGQWEKFPLCQPLVSAFGGLAFFVFPPAHVRSARKMRLLSLQISI